MLDSEDKLHPIPDYLTSFPAASELQEDLAQPGGTNMTNTPSHQCAHVHAQVVWDVAATNTPPIISLAETMMHLQLIGPKLFGYVLMDEQRQWQSGGPIKVPH